MSKIFILSFIAFFLFACTEQATNNKENIALNDTIDYIQEITLKLRDNPNDPELFFQRAEGYQKANKIQNAISDIEFSLKIDSLIPKYYLKISDLYMYLGQSGKAKVNLEKCEVLFPENTEVLLKLAQIHFFVQQYVESMNYLNKIQEIDRTISEVYFVKGLIYKENLDTVNAVKNLHIAVDVNPNYYEAYILLGLFSANSADTLSLDYYRNAIRINLQNIEAHYNMAMFYQGRGMTKQAINMYEYIIENIDSTSSSSYFNLAHIRMSEWKDFINAIDYYQKAIQINPNYFDAYVNIGFCYESLKQYQKAFDNYKIALEIVPNYPLAIAGLNRVDKYIN